ncbi:MULTISPECIES: roadblock/LC7 domain-containing protein [unclassified Plantactinospora]|uniref:roadblock/LC7 domain-containing protein n=1 Tax=unclassified Plantactinospora TaxID=2631981 RepID=UPI000D171FAE|nr:MULTISPECIES: roadblock/LC7 domain-containing protein [unclassified Plantactinospora]AVT30314.1 dynein regulation protein LC7 [Plantactinospora sp. BC1]AVT37076.1 dynein regulation protein LC7 [Plantactinospora sp. BB1]
MTVTQFQDARGDLFDSPLPRRSPGAQLDSGGEEDLPEGALDQLGAGTAGRHRPGQSALHAELGVLRDRVPGVRGAVLAGIDGRLLGHDLTAGPEPLDLAALAATTFGLGRQCGMTLQQGPLRELTVHSHQGYFTVYGVSDHVLLAVLGDDRLNVSWLHLEAGPVAERIADLLHVGGTT